MQTTSTLYNATLALPALMIVTRKTLLTLFYIPYATFLQVIKLPFCIFTAGSSWIKLQTHVWLLVA